MGFVEIAFGVTVMVSFCILAACLSLSIPHNPNHRPLVRINGRQVFAAPMSLPPPDGTTYYLADPTEDDCKALTWEGMDVEKRWLEKGLLHALKHDAQFHKIAMGQIEVV